MRSSAKAKLGDYFRLAKRLCDPGRNLSRFLRSMKSYPRYLKDFRTYRKAAAAVDPSIWHLNPQLLDNTSFTPFDSHYFYQDLWAFKQILLSGVSIHVDVGSLVKYVGFVSTITNVAFVDIRPVATKLETLLPIRGTILALPFKNNSISSLSCLHAAEHIGLGRYGDHIDPHGTQKAIRELARVLAMNGNLYFSLPVGKPRLCFNAHRIHAPQEILEYFKDLRLSRFSVVTDCGVFIEEANPSDFSNSTEACGLFYFVKER